MLTHRHAVTAASALLLLGRDASAASTTKQKMDFLRAMKSGSGDNNKRARRRLTAEDRKEFDRALHGDSKKSSELRKKLIERSTVSKPPGGGGGRKLQNNNNNYNANQYANAYANSNANDKDGSDDYYAINGDWENNFGFDPTQFSLSYYRCAAVRQFDDEIASLADTESVFATKHFAVFRFCPERTCMGINEEEFECDEDTYGQQYCEMMRQQQQNGWGQGYQGQDYQGGQNNNNNADGSFNFDYLKEEQRVFGARGEGCSSNYGEYMIELEDYLALMLEYHEERFQTYCAYCEVCMWEVYNEWLQQGGQQNNHRRELVTFEDFKNNSEEHLKRDLRNDDEVDGSIYNVCPEYDTCDQYYNTCQHGMYADLTEYFTCTEVERNNDGRVAYVSPHCAEDGFSVTLGLYSDEYCNEYIGNGVDIANFIGQELDVEEDALKPWYNSANGALEVLDYANEENVCIPCAKLDLPYEDSDYVPNDDDTDDYTENMNYDSDEINPICATLHESSARCDKHYRSYSARTKGSAYAEARAREDLSCDFIDSVAMGKYDEMGFLVDDAAEKNAAKNDGFVRNSLYGQEYGHYVTEVNGLQVFGLVTSLLACGLLAAWSVSLYKSVRSSERAWKPRTKWPGSSGQPDAVDMARQGSDFERSRTDGTSYYVS